MRPTDVCHLYELRVPVPRAFPARSRDLHRAGTPRSLGLRAVLPGEGVFHGTHNRFGGSFRNTTGFISRPRFVRSPRGGRQLRAWASSSHGAWNFRSCLWHPCRSSSFAESKVAFATLLLLRASSAWGSRQDRLTTFSWKTVARGDPGCLLP